MDREESFDRRTLLAGLGAAGAFAATGTLMAGALNPPAGPVGATMKTLDQVEPRIPINATTTPGNASVSFRITEPGSYYLEQNLVREPGKDGIEIAALGVTLDLMGHAIIGEASGTGRGVTATGDGRSRVTIRNGVIRSWQHAVHLGGDSTIPNATLENLDISNTADSAVVVNSFASISNCVFANTTVAITGQNAVLVRSCVMTGLNPGVPLIILQDRSMVENCVSSRGPFVLGAGATVRHCLFDGQEHSQSDSAVIAPSAAFIEHNHFRGHPHEAVRVSNHCVIRNNAFVRNGLLHTSGSSVGQIFIDGQYNVISDNHIAAGGCGVHITGTKNVIVRNVLAGNVLGFHIANNNYYGTIVNRVGGTSPAVNGNGASSSLTTTDAWANVVT